MKPSHNLNTGERGRSPARKSENIPTNDDRMRTYKQVVGFERLVNTLQKVRYEKFIGETNFSITDKSKRVFLLPAERGGLRKILINVKNFLPRT